MRCPRCLNEDPNYFYKGSKGWYCRKCVSFKRMLLEDKEELKTYQSDNSAEYQLKFELTPRQKEVSLRILKEVKEGNSVLVNAVTGAGKTELVYETIKHYLEERKTVGIAIARRQVVLQLASRLQRDFPYLNVVKVCEGYTAKLYGNIVVCTTHQLFRYYQYFDLLIIDEPDAYPFTNNDVLHGIAKTACKGQNIYLTATPDKWLRNMIEKKEVLEIQLPCRPSNRPLPLPVVSYDFQIIMFIKLLLILYKQNKEKKATLVYFPTIKMMNHFFNLLRTKIDVKAISSKTINKDEIIRGFLDKDYLFLFSTTILERGVTFPFIDIIIYHGEHIVFNENVLVQIMGRIQRDVRDKEGKGIIISNRKTKEIRKCIENIKEKNQLAFGVDVN